MTTQLGHCILTSRAKVGKADQEHLRLLLAKRRHLSLLINGTAHLIVLSEEKGQRELWAILQEFKAPLDDVYFFPQAARRSLGVSKDDVIAVLWAFVDLDDTDANPGEILDELGRRGFPSPTLVVETPHGYQVLWKLERKIFLGYPGDPQRERRVSFFEATMRATAAALSDLGADPQATNLNRYIRLNGNFLYVDPKARTSLGELWKAAKAWCQKKGIELPRPRGRKPPIWNGRRWGLQGQREWLESHIFKRGYRNQAVLAYELILLHLGVPPEHALELAREFSRNNCDPHYPVKEVWAMHKSLMRRWESGNPMGISPAKLFTIPGLPRTPRTLTRTPSFCHSERGFCSRQFEPEHAERLPEQESECSKQKAETMPKALAYSHLPRFSTKPVEERIKKPKIYWLGRLLETIGEKKITRATVRELQQATGIPRTTLTTTLKPGIEELEASQCALLGARPAGHAGTPPNHKNFLFFTPPTPSNLKQRGQLLRGLKGSETRKVAFLLVKTIYSCPDKHLPRIIGYWSRRVPNIWRRIIRAIGEILTWWAGYLSCLWAALAPPDDATEAQDSSEGIEALTLFTPLDMARGYVGG